MGAPGVPAATAPPAADEAVRVIAGSTRGERLAALAAVTRRLAGSRSGDDVAGAVAQEACRALGGTGAAVHLVDGDQLTLAVRVGPETPGSGPARGRVGEGPWGRVAATGRPVRLAAAPAPDGGEAGEGYLGVPVVAGGRVRAVLSVSGPAAARATAEDLALLGVLADVAAAGLDRSRLVQELLHAQRLSAVGRIVAGVAHELNNPLAVVVGLTDLLRRDRPADARLDEQLARIAGQAQRAVRIVRALLALARKRPTRRVAVDLHRLLDETLALEAHDLRRATIAVERRFAADLPPALGDSGQLQQVLLNLVMNAVEALAGTGRGGTLTLTTAHEPGSDRVAVTVADDGPGVPAADRARVFEPFYTTKGEGQGTGLGLPICRQIVESHRGRIWLAGGAERGAAFTVELPVAAPAAAAAAAPPDAPGPGASAHVLLVEDESVVGDLLAEYLALDGHRVDRAANGREALDLVRGRRYALIVSDVRMPDLDGPSFYRELLTLDPALARRMVFVTGDVMNRETRRFLEETGLLFLEKPFGIAEFLALVRRALGRPAPPPRPGRRA